jgi:two-component system sensor histidine kinase YesM
MGILYTISNSITRPIDDLIENTKKLAEGDFGVHIENDNRNEITALNESFNSMVKKLRILMDTIKENAREREKLELRLMQEQIKPHFLYNTLETIIWMAESGDKEKIIQIVKSLSRFFRMVLSEGKDIVTVREELSYIESYLFIQQMRYGDIMNYEIEAAEEVMNYRIQKLSLQPLVENALYHGIKNKRAFGIIRVTARIEEKDLVLSVYDDGCGMSEEKLYKLCSAIEKKQNPSSGSFGLSNLQNRIQLYYGEEYGITINSCPNKGTVIILRISAEIDEANIVK